MASYQGLDSKGVRKPTPTVKVPEEVVDDGKTPRAAIKASLQEHVHLHKTNRG